MYIYEYKLSGNEIMCHPVEVIEKPNTYKAARHNTLSYRSVYTKSEEGKNLSTFNSEYIIFLSERDDERARTIMKDVVTTQIENQEAIITNLHETRDVIVRAKIVENI